MKKLISMILLIAMMATTTTLNVFASTYDTETTMAASNTIELEESLISSVDTDTLMMADAILMGAETYEQQNVLDMYEVLDNGTDLIISTNDVEKLVSDFDPDICPQGANSGKIAGYYITSNGMDYSVSAIEYALMIEEGAEDEYDVVKATEYLNEIIANDPIDVDLVLNDAQANKKIDRLIQLEPDDVAKLQASTDLGNSFLDNDKFVYFYKYGNVNGTGTDYVYDESTSKNGYAKLGSLNFFIYAIEIKTVGTTTYDAIFATCTASGLSGKYVYKFNTSLSVDEDSNNKIVDYTNPVGGESSVTGGIALTINNNNELELGLETSYTYNPNELSSIVPECGEKYVKTWNCTAYNNTSYKNWSWTVKPAIIVKKTDGTTDSMTATVFVDYFRVSGGWRWYTIKEKASCDITFKNHKGA